MDANRKHYLLPAPEGSKEAIRKIYNLEGKRLEEALDILHNWIQKQDHIIKKDFSRHYLESTLITCKGSVERAKKQIDRLCTLKTLLPKFFAYINVKEEMAEYPDTWILPMPKITSDLYRIVMAKVTSNKITTEIMSKYFRYCLCMTEFVKAHDYANGFIVIMDFRVINVLEILPKLNFVEIQQCLTILIEGYGARLKNIHILSESKVEEILIKIVKQFVSEKIGNRIQVHPTFEDLYKFVPKEYLPMDYGGLERSVEEMQRDWLDALTSKEHLEYMKMMRSACTDESRRQDGKFNEEYLGMPGSFRNLKVD